MDRDAFTSTEMDRLRSRNDLVVRGSLFAYLALFIVLALSHPIRSTPDVFLTAIALVSVLIGWRLAAGSSPARDWLPFVLLALAYELIRAFGPTLVRNVNVDLGAAVDRALLGGAIASDVLQRALRPAVGLDVVGLAATVVYGLHTLLPVVVGAYLWVHHRRHFHDFVAALVILSLAAFATYLLLPVAPPWWAAAFGHLPVTVGQGLPGHLQGAAVEGLLGEMGLVGGPLVSFLFQDVSPDPVAAFPSLHAAYPVLAYLVLRAVAGPAKWVMLAYTAAAWFAIVYLGDHYLIDIAAGLTYAVAAWWLVVRSEPMSLGARLIPDSTTSS
jgi:PAP2 superfamily